MVFLPAFPQDLCSYLGPDATATLNFPVLLTKSSALPAPQSHPCPSVAQPSPLASSTTEPEHFRPHPTGDSNTSTHCLGAFVTGGNGKAAKSDEIRKEGKPQKSRVTCAILPFAVGALQTRCVQRNAPSPPEAESASQREGSRSVDSLTSTKLGKPEKISGD